MPPSTPKWKLPLDGRSAREAQTAKARAVRCKATPAHRSRDRPRPAAQSRGMAPGCDPNRPGKKGRAIRGGTSRLPREPAGRRSVLSPLAKAQKEARRRRRARGDVREESCAWNQRQATLAQPVEGSMASGTFCPTRRTNIRSNGHDQRARETIGDEETADLTAPRPRARARCATCATVRHRMS